VLGTGCSGQERRAGEGESVIVEVVIRIPDWVERFFVWPVLLYRRVRYGYMFRRIGLSKGKWVKVDPEDYWELCGYKWCVSQGGDRYYAVRAKSKRRGVLKMELMHRVIAQAEKGLMVDHINRNTLDNRRANLRVVSAAENTYNKNKPKRRKKLTSRYKGVYRTKRDNYWHAVIGFRGIRKYLGRFESEECAARAYDAAARKYHGEFASPNFEK